MPDPPLLTSPEIPGVPDPPEREKKKKKDKIRSAWISFVGRVVAQVVGAVATIVLTLYFVQRSQAPSDTARPAAEDLSRAGTVARSRPAGGEPALAVLPLENFSGDPQQDYFADGMTEAIIADLATVKGLRVISRTSSMAYKDRQKGLPQIARELGVDLIVEGSVVKSGDRVRVTAQLIDAKSDEHLWAETYDRTIRDVLALQGQMAAAIAGEVVGVVKAALPARLASKASVDPAVYDLYLRGRAAWNLRTPAGFEDAIRYFEQALAKAPDFALAYAGLADAHQLRGPGVDSEGPAKAKAAAERALRLDDGLGEAHASLGGLLHRSEADIAGASREFRRAIDLNPGYATSHQWYAILLAEEGEEVEALRHGQQAVALDPLSGPMHQTLGLVHYYGRRFDEASRETRRALEIAPQLLLAREILSRSLLAQGLSQDAINVWDADRASANGDVLATLGVAYLRTGQGARADAIAKELLAQRPAPLAALARWYAATGNPGAAIESLEQLNRQRPGGLQPLRNDPRFDDLRSDRRFINLVRRER